jgi:GTP cyclohydrolase I
VTKCQNKTITTEGYQMSFNKTKTDPELGLRVHEYLERMGVETPVISNGIDRKDKISKIESHFREIMSTLGLDLTDDSLIETPNRVAKMLVTETMWGLDFEAFPKCTAVDNKMHYNEMVVERNINVQSNCEHHFVVIDGLATVAYVPNRKVLGLSKINRIVEYFSKRPQIQERLTEQIFYALQFILETNDVAVMIDARHYCVISRGVEDTGSSTVTTRLGGGFKSDPEVRNEFYQIARMR